MRLVFFASCLALPAAAAPTLEQEQEIRTSFVTPHTKWAKPYAEGTTRVLFFSDDKNTQAREIVELMQHLVLSGQAAGVLWRRRGDLRYRVDFRRLYGEIARVWWGQGDAGAARLGTAEPGLGFL